MKPFRMQNRYICTLHVNNDSSPGGARAERNVGSSIHRVECNCREQSYLSQFIISTNIYNYFFLAAKKFLPYLLLVERCKSLQ